MLVNCFLVSLVISPFRLGVQCAGISSSHTMAWMKLRTAVAVCPLSSGSPLFSLHVSRQATTGIFVSFQGGLGHMATSFQCPFWMFLRFAPSVVLAGVAVLIAVKTSWQSSKDRRVKLFLDLFSHLSSIAPVTGSDLFSKVESTAHTSTPALTMRAARSTRKSLITEQSRSFVGASVSTKSPRCRCVGHCMISLAVCFWVAVSPTGLRSVGSSCPATSSMTIISSVPSMQCVLAAPWCLRPVFDFRNLFFLLFLR